MPAAASAALRAFSSVVAVCSSTAAAVVAWWMSVVALTSLICPITSLAEVGPAIDALVASATSTARRETSAA